MANKDLAIFLKKLQGFYSNTANNGKLPKVNTTTGAIDAVDPSTFATSGVAGGNTTYVVNSFGALPLSGVNQGSLGVINYSNGCDMYIWSTTATSGTAANWKKLSPTAVAYPPYVSSGFSYGATTTTPVDATNTNNFSDIAFTGANASIVGDNIEIRNNGGIFQSTPTVSTRFTTQYVRCDLITTLYIPTLEENNGSVGIRIGLFEGAVHESGSTINENLGFRGLTVGYSPGYTYGNIRVQSLGNQESPLPRGVNVRIEARFAFTYNSVDRLAQMLTSLNVFNADTGAQYSVPVTSLSGFGKVNIENYEFYVTHQFTPTGYVGGQYLELNPRFGIFTNSINNPNNTLPGPDTKIKRVIFSRNW